MKTRKTKQEHLGTLVLAAVWLALSSNAVAVATFSAETEARLELIMNPNLSVSIVDTYFDVFEAGIGDAATTAVTEALPTVDAFAGDPPLGLALNETLDLSLKLDGTATSTPLDPFSTANASVLGTAVLRIETLGANPGDFDFQLSWAWQGFLSVDHLGEMAGIDLELVVAAYDDLGNSLLNPINVYSVSLDTALGDMGNSLDSGSLRFGGLVDADTAWNVIVDLFAVNGRAQSTLQQGSVPVPAPLALLATGLLVLVSRRRHSTRS